MLPKAIVGPQAGTGVKETEERERENRETKGQMRLGGGCSGNGRCMDRLGKADGTQAYMHLARRPGRGRAGSGPGSRLALCGHGDDGASVPIFAFARIGIGDRDWDGARAGGTSQGQ